MAPPPICMPPPLISHATYRSMSRHRVVVEYHLRESGNCDGFKKEKILKTSREAVPNYRIARTAAAKLIKLVLTLEE